MVNIGFRRRENLILGQPFLIVESEGSGKVLVPRRAAIKGPRFGRSGWKEGRRSEPGV